MNRHCQLVWLGRPVWVLVQAYVIYFSPGDECRPIYVTKLSPRPPIPTPMNQTSNTWTITVHFLIMSIHLTLYCIITQELTPCRFSSHLQIFSKILSILARRPADCLVRKVHSNQLHWSVTEPLRYQAAGDIIPDLLALAGQRNFFSWTFGDYTVHLYAVLQPIRIQQTLSSVSLTRS